MSTNAEIILKGKYQKSVHNMIKLSVKEKKEFTEQMVKYANNFLIENFNLKLNIPIEIDGRLTKTGGSFHFLNNRQTKECTPKRIKMSERFIACALKDKTEGVHAILDVLNHELVHYALCVSGKEFNDGTVEFEQTLAKLNIGSSGATHPSKRLSKRKNVWYKIEDIYDCPIMKKRYVNKHTQKEQNWIGKRTEFQIVKSYF